MKLHTVFFAGLLGLGYSMIGQASTITTLGCTIPEISGEALMGVRAPRVEVLTDHGSSYFLVTGALSPDAPEERTQLNLVAETDGYFVLNTPGYTVDLSIGLAAAVVLYNNGAVSYCANSPN